MLPSSSRSVELVLIKLYIGDFFSSVFTCSYSPQAGAQVDCQDRITGERPLHVAAALGHLEMIAALFRNGADVRMLRKTVKYAQYEIERQD